MTARLLACGEGETEELSVMSENSTLDNVYLVNKKTFSFITVEMDGWMDRYFVISQVQ